MRNSRFRFLAQVASVGAASCLPRAFAAAPQYPTAPIKLIVPFAPGAGADGVARVLGRVLATPAYLGQPVIVDNRGGAGGVVGLQLAAKAPPDGYTLFVANAATHAINVSYRPDAAVDPQRAFVPVTQVSSVPLILCVSSTLKVKTLAELVALAKKEPKLLTYASTGTGSLGHLGAEIFKEKAGIQATHVPYTGTALALTDLVSGRVSMVFTTTPSVLPQLNNGTLTMLAVCDKVRTPLKPDVPTMAECGVKDFEVSSWGGIVAPTGTPQAIIDTLYSNFSRALREPEVQEHFTSTGARAIGSDPKAFGAFLQREVQVWAGAVRLARLNG
jgi:tripartite-type tricarboxylate transporter receptor subunit TctC